MHVVSYQAHQPEHTRITVGYKQYELNIDNGGRYTPNAVAVAQLFQVIGYR